MVFSRMKNEWLILIPILTVTTGQICAKYGVLHMAATGRVVNLFVIAAYSLMLTRGLIWIFILRKVKLSFAYPFLSITYITVLFLSHELFDEPITANNLLGCCIIMAGTAVIGFGENRLKAKSDD